MSNLYIRLATFSLEEVLPFVVMGPPLHGEAAIPKRPRRMYAGKEVRMDSMRYQTFVNSGIACVKCGLQGEFFALETHHNAQHDRYHLNMYGRREGEEILFTKDHIKPKGKGGRDVLSNFQTMCAPCNNLKGNYVSSCGKAADPMTLLHQQHGKKMRRIGQLQLRISDRLCQIREDGLKLRRTDNPSGGEEFLAYHEAHRLEKQILKSRLKKVDILRERLAQQHTRES